MKQRLQIFDAFAVIDRNSQFHSARSDIILEYYQETDRLFDDAIQKGLRIPTASDVAPQIFNKYMEQGLGDQIKGAKDFLFTQIRPYIDRVPNPAQPLGPALAAIRKDAADGVITATQELLYTMAAMDLRRQGITAEDLDRERGALTEPTGVAAPPPRPQASKDISARIAIFFDNLKRMFSEKMNTDSELAPEP